jgi:hypothetical protein
MDCATGERTVKKFLLALSLVAVLACQAVTGKSIEKTAWDRATKLAQVNPDEAERWAQRGTVDVMIYMLPRYMPQSPTQGLRLCGDMTPVYEGGVGLNYLKIYIRLFMRPQGEEQLMYDTLTHEYLHLIWLERLIDGNQAFIEANPESEEYVVSLIPNSCPNV